MRHVPRLILIALTGAALTLFIPYPGPFASSDEPVPLAPDPVTVPSGAYGDRVVYTQYERSMKTAPWKFVRSYDFTFSETPPALNASAAAIEAVRVTWEEDAIVHEWYVDVSNRDVFRADEVDARDPLDLSHTTTFAAPELPVLHPLRLLPLQRTTFSPNATRPEGLPLEQLANVFLDDAFVEIRPAFFTDGGPAPSESPLATGYWRSTTIKQDGGEALRVDLTQGIKWQGYRDPPGSNRTHEWSIVVSAKEPFPLRLEHRDVIFTADQHVTVHEDLLVRSHYESGKKPIPWRAPLDVPESPLERSGATERAPRDGTGFSFVYGLDAAQRSVLHDPTLVEFAGWYAAHPSVYLTAAHGSSPEEIDEDDVDDGAVPLVTATWRLVYAAPYGGGFVIDSTLDARSGAISNVAFRVGTMPFDEEKVPVNLVTLGQAEALWRQVAPPGYADQAANVIDWGWWVNPGDTLFVAPDPDEDERYLTQLEIGRDDHDGCTGVLITGDGTTCVTDYESRVSTLWMNVATGTLRSSQSSLWQIQAAPLPIPASDQPPAAPAAAFVPAPSPAGEAIIRTSAIAAIGGFGLYHAIRFFAANVPAWVAAYAKVRKDQVLQHRLRDRIFELVQQQPGIAASDLHRQFEIGWTTLGYHLSVLERNGFLRCVTVSHTRRYFHAASMSPTTAQQQALLLHAPARAVFESVRASPGLGLRELARRLDRSAPSTLRQVRRLLEARLIERDPSSSRKSYRATDRAAPTWFEGFRPPEGERRSTAKEPAA